MSDVDPDELEAWTAANKRARDAAYAEPRHIPGRLGNHGGSPDPALRYSLTGKGWRAVLAVDLAPLFAQIDAHLRREAVRR